MSDQQFKWYIIHTTSNCEKKVKQTISENFEKKNLSCLLNEIIVPSVEVSKVRRGKDVKLEKKIMPGYVLIKMVLTDESWQLVKSIPQVTNFLGGPSSISDIEVENIINQIKIHQENSQNQDFFEVGETINITDGPFDTFNGIIDLVDIGKSRLKVSVSIFGRLTPIDLNFSQVRKINRL